MKKYFSLVSFLSLVILFFTGCNFKFEEETRPPRYDLFWTTGGVETLITGDEIALTDVSASDGFKIILVSTGEAYLIVESYIVESDTPGYFTLGETVNVGKKLSKNDESSAVIHYSIPAGSTGTGRVIINTNAIEYETKTITLSLGVL